MKHFVALVLKVVVFLVFAGSTLGDGEGEVPNGVCSVTVDEGKPMHTKIDELGFKCVDPSENVLPPLGHLESSSDEIKDLFKRYCRIQPQIRECLAGVARKSQSCQNQTRHQLFQIYHEQLETILDAGCVQDGEALANIMRLSGAPVNSDFNPLTDCMQSFVMRLQMSSYIDISDFSRPYIFYRNVVQAKECVSSIREGDQHQKNAVESILSVLAEKLKCFHPEDDSVLSCKNLDPKHDGSSRVCPIKSVNEQTNPLYDSIRDRLPYCYLPLTIVLNEILFKDDFESLEESRKYFKNECQKLPSIKNCLKELSSFSSSCLDVKHQLVLSTIKDFMTNVFEHVCLEEGQHLANVVFNIARHEVANNSEPNVNFRRFPSVRIAVQKAFATDVTSQKTLELYRDMKVFKGRLVNYLQGDNDAVSSAQLILNGVIENMKCPDHELTTSVPCASVASSA